MKLELRITNTGVENKSSFTKYRSTAEVPSHECTWPDNADDQPLYGYKHKRYLQF